MDIDTVIEMNKGLILSCVSKFYNVDKEDLYQAGVLGLLKAYQNYRFDGKTKFSSYAYKYIYGEMYLLACNQSIKVNKDLLKKNKLIEQAKYKLAQKINKIPSNEELATFLQLPLKDVEEALSSVTVLSIDNDNTKEIYDILQSNDNIDNQLMIASGLKYLTDEEKEVIISRYYHDMTQAETAKKLSLSQVTISRFEKRSLNKLHDYMKV